MKKISILFTILFFFSTFSFSQTGFSQVKLGQPPVLDFDGDGKSDFLAVQPVNQTKDSVLTWHILQSRDGYRTLDFGNYTIRDVPVPADYDGDGKWDIAFWRRGMFPTGQSNFIVLNSATNSISEIPWGRTSDNPRMTQDFDGDGKADPTIVRKENGKLYWWVLQSTGGHFVTQFGIDTDYSLRGDFDGDGKADAAVYRNVPSGETPPFLFIIQNSSDKEVRFAKFGTQLDFIIPGDFDADGRTDLVIYRGYGIGNPNALWYCLRSSDGGYDVVPFGLAFGAINNVVDLPAPGDYDGDGRTDFAVWRMSTDLQFQPEFYVLGSKSKNFFGFPWGLNDMAIPNFDFQVVRTDRPQ
jgi:hypothetical protein